MFNWCQSVNIYNIENHYHFYSEQEGAKVDVVSLGLSKLKPGSISVLSSTNSKRSSKSCSKRGLALTKQISGTWGMDVGTGVDKGSVPRYHTNNKYKDHRQSAFSDIPIVSAQSTQAVFQEGNRGMDDRYQKYEEQLHVSSKTEAPPSGEPGGGGHYLGQRMSRKRKPSIGDQFHGITNGDERQINNINAIITRKLGVDGRSANNQLIANGIQSRQLQLNSVSSRNGDRVSDGDVIADANVSTGMDYLKRPAQLRYFKHNICNNIMASKNEGNKWQQNAASTQSPWQQQSGKVDMHQMTTSRHLHSKETSEMSQSEYEHIVALRDHNGSKYNVGASITSYSQPQSQLSSHQRSASRVQLVASGSRSSIKSEQCIYVRIMEQSRGEARQASIMLSDILSRTAQESPSVSNSCHNCSRSHINHDGRRDCDDSSHQPCFSMVASHIKYMASSAHNPNSSNNRKRLNLWQDQDKNTIISKQNDGVSECSLRVEESQLCDNDTSNNFLVLPNGSSTNSYYSLKLAVEVNMWCLVSLKEIGFREMGMISQELQMYEFVELKMQGCDLYRNILQLYQIQMRTGSYLLIKEPYTRTLSEHLASLTLRPFHSTPAAMDILHKHLQQLSQIIQELLASLLFQFAYFLIYPSRLLTIHDFVICEGVVKLHDLSFFKQNKYQIVEPYRILQQFTPAHLQHCSLTVLTPANGIAHVNSHNAGCCGQQSSDINSDSHT